MFRWTSRAIVLAACLLSGAAKADEKPAEPVSKDHAARAKAGLALFKEHVRPLLVKHCVECHGGQSIKGDFDLTTRKVLMESGMVAESADFSQLYLVVAHESEPFMPHKRDPLPKKDVARIGKWIELGAPYDKPLVKKRAAERTEFTVTDADREFWSFQPLRRTEPPEVEREAWVRTPIDRFVLAAQEERGLHPNEAAARRVLIRRLSFDLIGLPPEPEEVERFVNDSEPRAYERLVDELLDSPHYGERWARHWMDVARFAESHGYEQDYDRPHAYHYRDFLIRAFNADMPYDRFVKWQLAGDELAPDDPLAMTATGFLGAGAFPTQLTEAEFESARYDELDDMVSTTGTAFLGLTIGCARCHDHKYDPIPSRDYYRLISAFTTTIRSEIELTLDEGAEPVKVQVTSEGFPHMKHHADGRGYPHFYPHTYFLKRGDVHQKDGVAQPGYLQVLMRDDHSAGHWQVDPPEGWERTSFRRAGLANWLTDTEHGAGHLLARVIVNRLWHHHFGRGIVATPNDFGFQGERPTHPELLDWLASDLIEHGWRLKRLHRMIVNSAVYRQNGDFDEARAKIDRENVYLWRRAPQRLEAEPIRDAMLAVSGLLDRRMFGPGTLDESMRRRSVYFFVKRSKLIPTMMLFDWPEHLVSIGRRSETTIAPQALALMNGDQTRRYAEGFAKRLEADAGEKPIQRAYRIAFGRAPTEAEVELSRSFLESQTKRYGEENRPAPRHDALVDFCQTLLSANEFVYVE